jgi:hypothetical protein
VGMISVNRNFDTHLHVLTMRKYHTKVASLLLRLLDYSLSVISDRWPKAELSRLAKEMAMWRCLLHVEHVRFGSDLLDPSYP